MSIFQNIVKELKPLIIGWEEKFKNFSEVQISVPKNVQNRTIKQIVGHMVDSASNNTHRVVHLQYQETPFVFPNYATYGNNDRWIAIQNYQDENWSDLIQLWKYSHWHFLHVIQNCNPEKLDVEWIADALENKRITLKEMIEDFPRHFKLHLSEIERLTVIIQDV